MKEDKILQIIPAPAGLWALHGDEEGNWNAPVVCLALMEDHADKTRYVEEMEMSSEGYIDPAVDPTFKKFIFKTAHGGVEI